MQKAKSKDTTLKQSDIPKIVASMKDVFLTREEFNKKIDQIPTREEIHKAIRVEIDTAKEELRTEIRLLPTKDEFFSRMDELMGEVKAIRESQELHAGQHRIINDRLDKHDQVLGISTAV